MIHPTVVPEIGAYYRLLDGQGTQTIGVYMTFAEAKTACDDFYKNNPKSLVWVLMPFGSLGYFLNGMIYRISCKYKCIQI